MARDGDALIKTIHSVHNSESLENQGTVFKIMCFYEPSEFFGGCEGSSGVFLEPVILRLSSDRMIASYVREPLPSPKSVFKEFHAVS